MKEDMIPTGACWGCLVKSNRRQRATFNCEKYGPTIIYLCPTCYDKMLSAADVQPFVYETP